MFPFVALQLYDDGDNDSSVKEAMTGFLIGLFLLWMLLNVAFFCTIDLSYLGTFFGTMTAPQYTCMLYVGERAKRASRGGGVANSLISLFIAGSIRARRIA